MTEPSTNASTNPPAAASPDDARCGHCGYCVNGITSLRCPECGSDLRVVGIITHRIRRRFNPAAIAVIWSLMLMILSLPISAALIHLLPNLHMMRTQRFIFSQFSPIYATIEASTETQWFGRRMPSSGSLPPLHQVSIRVQGGNSPSMSPSPLIVDWGTKAFHYTVNGKTVQQSGGFGPEALLAWMEASGIKTRESPETLATWKGPPLEVARSERAQQIIADIDEMPRVSTFTMHELIPRGPHTTIAQPPFVYDRPSGWTTAVVVAFWLLLWAAGVRWILRRGKPI